MHIVLVGLNHRSAPVELREQLAFRREQLPAAFARLLGEIGLQEAAILSTCNRVEVYAAVPELNGAVDRLQRFLSAHSGVELSGLSPRLYSYTEPQSVQHLFSVTSGLDSMVLGESEILHQVKHAYEWAREDGAAGKVFNVLFQRAFNAAKAVRTQTAIGRGCTSIGTVSIELSEKIFGGLASACVLLIGAGKMGELTLKRLSERGVKRLRIMNRSPERAAELASLYGASPVPLDALFAQLLEADIVITSTSAPSYLLTRQELGDVMHHRHQRPLCVVDLGVPRNVDPSAAALENVYLFNIDDLQGLVAHYHKERQQALTESQAIIDRKVERFISWWNVECGMWNAELGAVTPNSELRTPN